MAPLNYSLNRSADSGEFVTLAKLRPFLGLTPFTTGTSGNAQNTMLTDMVAVARDRVESDTRRAYLEQTLVFKTDCFPVGLDFIELPRPPLKSVTTLKYIPTTGGSLVTWSSTNYEVDTNRTPGAVYLKYGKSWPSERAVQNSVEITFVAGYSTAATSVPDVAHEAVKMLVADRFFNRCTEGPANRDAYMSLVQTLRWGDYR